MSKEYKKTIAVVSAAFILLIGYSGNYLPLKKSVLFISALRNSRKAATLNDFFDYFSRALDVKSPIGQEELVRNTGNTILDIIQNNRKLNPAVISSMVEYIESYYEPIIRRGKGMSFSQNLYLLGSINEFAYIKTGEKKYLDKAEEYYNKGTKLAPKRPQFLYGLFELYRLKGDKGKALEAGNLILNYWPNDEKTRRILSDISNNVKKESTKTK